jgi:hypothetical protein
VGVTGDGTPQPSIPAANPPFVLCTVPILPGIARSENPFIYVDGYDTDEDVALKGQSGFVPSSGITADNVFIGGIRLPYVATSTSTSSSRRSRKIRRRVRIVLQGNEDPSFPLIGAPVRFPYPIATFGGVTGEIRQPIINDPFFPASINGQQRLTATEVASIIDYAAQRVKITRAAIRLPIGTQSIRFPRNAPALREIPARPGFVTQTRFVLYKAAD